jgi:hypothetical protein
MSSPLGKSRGGTPEGGRPPSLGREEAAPHRKVRKTETCACRRSASFLFVCRVALSEAKPTVGVETLLRVGMALRAFAHPCNS